MKECKAVRAGLPALIPRQGCCCQHPPAALLRASVLRGSVLMDSASFTAVEETNFPVQLPWSWFPVRVQHKSLSAGTVPLIPAWSHCCLCCIWNIFFMAFRSQKEAEKTKPPFCWESLPYCTGPVTANPSSDTELMSLSCPGLWVRVLSSECLSSSAAPPKPRPLSAGLETQQTPRNNLALPLDIS